MPIPDKERKLLTILANFSYLHKRMPTFSELYRKTGLREGVHRVTLRRLAERYLIEWDGLNIETVKIEDGWRSLIR